MDDLSIQRTWDTTPQPYEPSGFVGISSAKVQQLLDATSEGIDVSDAPRLQPGERFQHFEIQTMLGIGGMGIVYKAIRLHDPTGGPVALKIVADHPIDPKLAGLWTHREAIIGRTIHSPYVARTLESGMDSRGLSYLATEYIEGEPMRSWIDRFGVLPQQGVVRMAIDALKGLERIHRAGIVHSDIKPGNLMVPLGAGTTPTSHCVKIIDFGIAGMIGDVFEEQDMVVGTAQYLSPEQLQHQALDPRSDLYSLGVVLYESLTGRPPFDGKNAYVIMDQRLRRETPPLPQIFDARLRQLIMTMLAKSPEQRWASAAQVRGPLEKWLETHLQRQTATAPHAQILKRKANPGGS